MRKVFVLKDFSMDHLATCDVPAQKYAVAVLAKNHQLNGESAMPHSNTFDAAVDQAAATAVDKALAELNKSGAGKDGVTKDDLSAIMKSTVAEAVAPLYKANAERNLVDGAAIEHANRQNAARHEIAKRDAWADQVYKSMRPLEKAFVHVLGETDRISEAHKSQIGMAFAKGGPQTRNHYINQFVQNGLISQELISKCQAAETGHDPDEVHAARFLKSREAARTGSNGAGVDPEARVAIEKMSAQLHKTQSELFVAKMGNFVEKHFPNIPGDRALKVRLVKAIDDIPDPEVAEYGLQILKAANALAKSATDPIARGRTSFFEANGDDIAKSAQDAASGGGQLNPDVVKSIAAGLSDFMSDKPRKN